MKVSIVIVNYHSELLIVDCLNSFLQFHEFGHFEFIIINNGGELRSLEQNFQSKLSIFILESGGNIGFAKANNLGLKYSKGEFILYLNADTLFVEPILDKLVEQLVFDPTVGLVACQLVNPDLSLQLSYHDGDRLFSKLWGRNPIAIKFFNATQRAKVRQEQICNTHQFRHDAPWLSGACMLLRKTDIEKYNWQWDEDFFMYWEDVELCYRIRKSGLSLYFIPDSKLLHIGGSGEVNVSLSRFIWMENAKLLFIEKTQGKWLKWVYVVWMKLELRLERFLERNNVDSFENTILGKEIDFYLKRKK
jgi:GT2 family glycosyltransferase